MIWVRIYFAFTSPRFDFFVDPWLYYRDGGMDIEIQGKGRIPLANNQAETALFRQTHPRVDDLALNVNKFGPNLEVLKRRGGDLRGDATDLSRGTEPKDSVSRFPSSSKIGVQMNITAYQIRMAGTYGISLRKIE